ncbi:LysR family transcriptional regulator [Anaerosphaera multitolerans]|uniref:LysR family transcriptional regulator n=1 Tax=Anaerosphaera multitolerans TaxID=2487351 RepID=UPI0013E29249|nr:LysR family transcriptional regulator [Anaerosphaera multitolerans]
MLDYRCETFLVLSELLNYTKTAQKLNITQPGVTQHIKYLEEYYKCNLFEYKNRKVALTENGIKLKEFLTKIISDENYFKEHILSREKNNKPIHFGATLTIGEYIMPDILSVLFKKNPDYKIDMSVANTQQLLEKLLQGTISFALVEGAFDKFKYGYEFLSSENFIGVCAPNSNLLKENSLEEIFKHSLIIREAGSGTREVFENILHQQNFSLKNFKNIIEIGNMSAIKKMVANNLGITFLYEAAVKKELQEGTLCKLNIPKLSAIREFNFIYLKDSLHKNEYLNWFYVFRNIYRT